jgi:hypothetical protein
LDKNDNLFAKLVESIDLNIQATIVALVPILRGTTDPNKTNPDEIDMSSAPMVTMSK